MFGMDDFIMHESILVANSIPGPPLRHDGEPANGWDHEETKAATTLVVDMAFDLSRDRLEVRLTHCGATLRCADAR